MSDDTTPRPYGEHPPTLPPAPDSPAASSPAPASAPAYPTAAPVYTPPPAAPGYGAQPVAPAPPHHASAPAYVSAPGPAGAAPGAVSYGTPAYGTYGAPASRPTSGLAIASLVCGIAGVVLFWAVVPFLASVAAVITGHLALGQTRRNPSVGGRGMAIAGLILGYVMVGVAVATLLSAIIGFLFMGAFTLPFLFAS